MHISQLGAGRNVVLIHGFCETHKVWLGVARQLAPTYRVLMPDLPGFGATALLAGSFSIEEAARHLLNRLVAEGADTMVIAGHSLGGYVALAMARLEPKRIKGLALVHSTALPDTVERKNNRNRVIDLIEQHGPEPFIRSFFQNLFAAPNHPAQQ